MTTSTPEVKFLGWTTSGWGAKCPNEAGSSSLARPRLRVLADHLTFKGADLSKGKSVQSLGKNEYLRKKSSNFNVKAIISLTANIRGFYEIGTRKWDSDLRFGPPFTHHPRPDPLGCIRRDVHYEITWHDLGHRSSAPPRIDMDGWMSASFSRGGKELDSVEFASRITWHDLGHRSSAPPRIDFLLLVMSAPFLVLYASARKLAFPGKNLSTLNH
ncbi:hypothetical protein M5K25_001911 [Dendrobium thyrsiflorum]|uniref:Uncharacterized protein n=1 Tax=Dendrobium thyrsiflorum TaxID=117978 RepID=A0ABD0VT32_DENTH